MKNILITLKKAPQLMVGVLFLFLSSFSAIASTGYIMDIDSGLVDFSGKSVTLKDIEDNKGGLYYQPFIEGEIKIAVYVDLGFYKGVADNRSLEVELAKVVSDENVIDKSLDGLVKAAYVYKNNGMYTLTNTAWVSDSRLYDPQKTGFSLNYTRINNRVINSRILIPAMRVQKEFTQWERYLKAFSYLHELDHASLKSTQLNTNSVKIMTLLPKYKIRKIKYTEKIKNMGEIRADLAALNLVYQQMLFDGLGLREIKSISASVKYIRALDKHSITHRTEVAISNFTNLVIENIEKYKLNGYSYGLSLINKIGY